VLSRWKFEVHKTVASPNDGAVKLERQGVWVPVRKLKKTMKKIVVSVWLALACAVAWAVPTVEQVQAEVQQGHYSRAEGMMREVIEAKPGSAKAHYIYAEILAHEGSFSEAAEEARKAKQLDPDIKFTQPEKFQAFEKLLERERRPAPRAETSNSAFPVQAPALPAPLHASGIPSWVWLAALGVVGYFLWRGFSRSQAAPSPSVAYGVPATVPPTGPGSSPTGGFAGAAGPFPNAPPISPSGGLLKTGLAVAGGVAAGMMVDELLHSRKTAGADQFAGLQPGLLNPPPVDDAAIELERRNVDFGNGNDWDAGNAGTDPGDGGSDDNGW